MLARRFSLALLGATLALSPACIEADIKTTLSKDGSGTMSMHMGLTEGMVAALADMKEVDPDSDMISETREIMMTEPDEATRVAMKAAGCEVLEFDGEQSDTKVYSKFKVAFSHLSKLTELDQIRPEGSDPGDSPGQEMMLVKNDDGTYTLSMTGPGGGDDEDEFEDENPFAESPDGDEAGDGESAEEPAEEDPEQAMKKAAAAMEILGKVMAEASKLKIVVGMDVPGEIVSHTPEKGAKVEGGNVVWTFDFATMMAEGMGGGAGMDGPFSVTFKMPEGESMPESALHSGPAKKASAEEPEAPEKK